MNGPGYSQSTNESKVMPLAAAESFCKWIKHAKKLPVPVTSPAGGSLSRRQKPPTSQSSGGCLANLQNNLVDQDTIVYRQKDTSGGQK